VGFLFIKFDLISEVADWVWASVDKGAPPRARCYKLYPPHLYLIDTMLLGCEGGCVTLRICKKTYGFFIAVSGHAKFSFGYAKE